MMDAASNRCLAASLRHGLDLLAVNETWVPVNSPDAVSNSMVPQGYRVINAPRTDGRRAGGVAFIYRDDLNITPGQINLTFSTFEFLVVRLVVGSEKFMLASIYRLQETSVETFLDDLSDLFDALSNSGGHPILAGDFNCPGTHPDTVDSRLDTWVSCYNLNIINDGPTRLNWDGGQSKLDVVIEPKSDRRLKAATTIPVGFSDHSLIKAQLQCRRSQAPLTIYSYRDHRRLDVAAFKHLVMNSPSVLSPRDDPDDQAVLLNADLQAALDQLAPLRISKRRKSKPQTRWLSPEARQAKRKRRQLERQFSKTKSEAHRRAYRAACRSANYLITKSLSSHICSEVEKASASSKLLWRTVRRLLHPCAGGSWYENQDTNMLASELSNFFTSKVDRIKTTIRNFCSTDPEAAVPVCEPESVLCSFEPVSPTDVRRQILALPNKTSPLDIIPITLLKSCCVELSVPIAHLVNRSFITGVFPAVFKVGLVTPLLKKPGLDVSDLRNFRPITNLSTISKLMERLVLVQLKPHLTNSPNFCPHQSAYRANHSTETTLLKVVNDILTNIDEGSVVGLVGLDISSAFDTIDHTLLLNRLQSDFGLSGTLLSWFQSYLQNRTFSVRVGTSVSSPISASSGVPQGSVLGPILFTVYVSPIGRLIDSCGVGYHCYADDTQLYTALNVPSLSGLSLLETCTSNLQRWFWQNDLLLNPDKSDAIFFGTRQRLHNLPQSLSVAGSNITPSDRLKTLGVTLDSTLTFGPHINNIVSSCNFHLRALRHVRRSIPQNIANTIACSIVSSRLDYCNSLLYNTSDKYMQKLQRVQNNLARVVCNVNRLDRPSIELLRELHWLPVRKRINFKIATITYRVIQQHQPAYLDSLVRRYIPTRTLRSSDQGLLTKPSSHTVTGSRRFSCCAPVVWNSLPLHVRSADSISTFKTRLKTYLFNAILP